MLELHQRLHAKVTDPDLEQSSTGNLGTALQAMGRYQEAIARHEEALALARLREDHGGESVWLGNLGISYYRLGELRQAIETYEQALAIDQELGDRYGEAIHLTTSATATPLVTVGKRRSSATVKPSGSPTRPAPSRVRARPASASPKHICSRGTWSQPAMSRRRLAPLTIRSTTPMWPRRWGSSCSGRGARAGPSSVHPGGRPGRGAVGAYQRELRRP